MIDLGDPVALTFLVTDSAGAPANATAATVTITLPDNTTATPTVTNPSTGTYSAAYITTQAGHHKVAWSATGVNARTSSDVFEVSPMDARLLISLDQARKGLRMPAGQTVDDEDLRDLINAARGPIEDLCGPILPLACDEWHDGGWSSIRLLQAPVISVTTVTESYGAGYNRTLSNQPLDGATYDAFGYTVDLKDGLVVRRISGRDGPFAAGRRNVRVTYTAGRTVIPANILRASRYLVRWMWQLELRGQRAAHGTPTEDVSSTPGGFLVPNLVLEALANERRLPGIA